jgi:hypothetical protein
MGLDWNQFQYYCGCLLAYYTSPGSWCWLWSNKWNGWVVGETEVLAENMSQCGPIHHRSHITWPGPPLREAVTNRLSYGSAIFQVSWNEIKITKVFKAIKWRVMRPLSFSYNAYCWSIVDKRIEITSCFSDVGERLDIFRYGYDK